MSGNNEEKPKPVLLFHISQSLFKNKRLKRRRLASKLKQKTHTKRPKPKPKKATPVNGHPTPNSSAFFSETIEIISTDDEKELEKPQTTTPCNQPTPEKTPIADVETSIVLSSGDEDEVATQARIFPMLTSETTVQTEVGNAVFELSLTQLKQNLQAITKKRKKHRERDTKRIKKRLNGSNLSNLSADLSISLISDDEEEVG